MTVQLAQAAGVGSAGAGEALLGAWLTKAVTVAVEAGSGYLHELLSRPTGSAATMANETTQTGTFTPDVLGTYRVRSRVTVAGETIFYTRVVRATRNATGVVQRLDLCAPAVNEAPSDGATTAQPQGLVDLWELAITALAAAAGGITIATNAPPAIAAASALGAVTSRSAREDHTHAHGGVATATADKLACRDGSGGCSFGAVTSTALTVTNLLNIDSEGVCFGGATEADQDGAIKLVEIETPSGSPSSGSVFIWLDDDDDMLLMKTSSGVLIPLDDKATHQSITSNGTTLAYDGAVKTFRSSAATATLPAGFKGAVFVCKAIVACSVSSTGGETFDDAAGPVAIAAGSSRTFMWDGSTWLVF